MCFARNIRKNSKFLQCKPVLVALFALLLTLPASALTYRERYVRVLAHYSQKDADSLKLRAALYLIDNMDGHQSPEGAAIDSYKTRLCAMAGSKGIRELQSAWNTALKDGKWEMRPDSAVVTDRLLISNIDAAFSAWETAAWHDAVSFVHFCKYILPYRCSSEHIGGNWRAAFSSRYRGVVSGVRDMREAFWLIRDTVFKDVALSNPYCPVTIDPITCAMAGRAECGQRCVVLVSVLRSLGIPAVIDCTPMWADYSSNGHAWVALVMADGCTYTIYEDDKEAQRFNPIDATRFPSPYGDIPAAQRPHDVKIDKTPIKVYRSHYHHANSFAESAPWFLADMFIDDVSAQYGLTDSVAFAAGGDEPVYLCAYLSAQDWMPVARTVPVAGKAVFHDVGKDVVCIPMRISADGSRHALSCPVLIRDNAIVRTFCPDATARTAISVNRKYPLCSYTTDAWCTMRGVFEGANAPDFSSADTLAVITATPCGITELPANSRRPYRYLRYKADDDSRSSMAEIRFVSAGELLQGRPFSNGVDAATSTRIFDGNPATFCRALVPGYYAGIDLGEGNNAMVDKVVFAPSTDLNFVERGHLYELYYFDTAWHLIGRKMGTDGYLGFDGVPQGALLLLKDKSGGREERIFEYVDGKQIWH